MSNYGIIDLESQFRGGSNEGRPPICTKLSHEALHAKVLNASKDEKTATLVLLEYLEQVESRRTYAVLGYPTHFKYVEEALKYSPSQASERVSVMRLLRKVPALAEQLTDGAHSLTSITKIAVHVRREKLSTSQTEALVSEMAHRSVIAVEKYLSGVALVAPPRVEKTKVVTPELTRITLDVDDEFMSAIQRLRDLRGNPALPLSQVLKSAMDEVIRKRELKVESPKELGKKAKKNEKPKFDQTSKIDHASQGDQTSTRLRLAEVRENPRRSRYIPLKTRNLVRIRAQSRCEYEYFSSELDRAASKSGGVKRCASRAGLQFEHVVPFAKGGAHDFDNLKLFCPAHNRLRAIEEFGPEKMAKYFRTVG